MQERHPDVHHAQQRSDGRSDVPLCAEGPHHREAWEVTLSLSDLYILSHGERGVLCASGCLTTLTGITTLRREIASHPGESSSLSPGLHRRATGHCGYDGQRDMTVGWERGVPRVVYLLIYRGVVWPPWIPGWYVQRYPPWSYGWEADNRD